MDIFEAPPGQYLMWQFVAQSPKPSPSAPLCKTCSPMPVGVAGFWVGADWAVLRQGMFWKLPMTWLKRSGYKWDDKEGDFVNPQEYTVECRSIGDSVKYGGDESHNYGWKPCGGISSYGRNMPDVAKSVYTSICQTQEVAGS